MDSLQAIPVFVQQAQAADLLLSLCKTTTQPLMSLQKLEFVVPSGFCLGLPKMCFSALNQQHLALLWLSKALLWQGLDLDAEAQASNA
mmetsp:Transcript_96188/g.170767  ORF Transcript_96188/g.170767 Transcript_96188/m.170767 type:complete len:88 (+) Transcript_96188:984-1247(+)